MAQTAAGELPIVQYWHSEEVPAEVATLIATFAEHNPERPCLLFDETSAESFIATHFTATETAAFRACALAEMQADYFRYCAAHVLGGICVDSDCRCVASSRSMLEGCSGRVFRRESGAVVNGLLAFSRPQHPLPRLAIDVATASIANRYTESVWATTGPGVPTALLRFHLGGSFEATLEQIGEPRWRELFEGFRAAIGSYARVTEAFEGVRVCPYDEIANWLTHADAPLAYKDPVVNWTNPGASIFRGERSI